MRSYKEDDLTPWRGVPWTVRCQLFSILYQRIVSNVARGALISYVFELLIFSNVDPMSRDVSASGRGFYGYSDADILCIPFWYTMSIEMTKNYIQATREFSGDRWGLDVSKICTSILVPELSGNEIIPFFNANNSTLVRSSLASGLLNSS